MSIITYPLNGVTYDAAAVETYLCTRTSGIFAGSGHFNASCGGGYNVTIGKGLAWINDGSYSGSTNRFTGKSICMTASTKLTLGAAAGAAARYDRIVLRFDRTKEPNESYLTVIEGTAAESPTAPAIVRNEDYYDLGLYLVYREAASTEITAADLTDTRNDSNICGIMSDSVTNVTPANIQAQYEALVERYREAIEATEAGSNCLLATATISETEIKTILAGGDATSEHRYLDAAGLQQVAQNNSTFGLRGTARFADGSTLGTTEFSSDTGWRELLLHYQGTHMEQALFYVNGGTVARQIVPETYGTGLSGYIHIQKLGQFLEVIWYEAANTQSVSTEAPRGRQILASGSGTKLTKLNLGMTATAAAVGYVEVYAR